MAKSKTIGPKSTTDINSLPSFNLGTDRTVRERAYYAFQNEPTLTRLTDHDKSDGVRVYSTLPEQEIKASLSRKEGYAIPPSERHKTKERVIASKAHYIANSSGDFHPNDPVGVTMLTSCAPNLRKSLSAGPENPNDYKDFVKTDGNLNADAYRSEMKKVWTRFFLAANEEAKRTGRKIDIITPLAGGGAYLEGLPEIEKAKRIIAETMIEAANTPSFQNIGEVHLAIPNQSDGTDSPDFALIEDVMSQSVSQKSITLSNTDMLTLGRLMLHSGKEIAICNPGSDHVPGGGAYNDRGQPLKTGGHSYNEAKGARPNHPGEFNGHPRALEEQLGQVSNFLYMQNKDQNPQHFNFIAIPQNIVSPSGQPIAPVIHIPSDIKLFVDDQRRTVKGIPCYEISAKEQDLQYIDIITEQLARANVSVYEKYQDKNNFWRLKFEKSPSSLTIVKNLINPSDLNPAPIQPTLVKQTQSNGVHTTSSMTFFSSNQLSPPKEVAAAVKNQIRGVDGTVWIYPKPA